MRSRSLFTHSHYVGEAPITVEPTGGPDRFRVRLTPEDAIYLSTDDALDLIVALANAVGESGEGDGLPEAALTTSGEDVLSALAAWSIFERLQEQARTEASDG